MAHLNQDIRVSLLRMVEHAQRRLDTLREVASTANENTNSSELRIVIGDAITPLTLAAELVEELE